MLPPSWSALLVLLFPSAIDARAVSADAIPLPPATATSFIASVATNATLSSGECDNIHYCRTLEGLVLSCLVTILACAGFAVHRNIPAPKVDRPRHANFFVRTGLFVWYKILDQRQAANVFVVALLVPEWVLVWALRQLIVARDLVEQLEGARAEANEKRESACKELASEALETEKEVSESSIHAVIDESPAESSGISTHSEHAPLINPQYKPLDRIVTRRCKKRCEDCDVHKSEYDQVAMAKRVGMANEAWMLAHAFFIIMGGYNFCGEDGPIRPVSPKNAVELVRRGHLVAPSSDELANQSKGDALSKGVAILQTLWFVMQCIARLIEHLPLTNLEVMTLAYTVITVAMYIVWWEKPLNVSCAVRVPEEEVKEEIVLKYDSVWERILAYVIGGQDQYVDLRQCTRVPTFWAADHNDDALIADVIALLVAMVFGAVHCIAWSYAFQSHLEQQLWRASAIAIIAVPAALALGAVVAAWLDVSCGLEFGTVLPIFYVPLASMYIAARIILILISFTSLRMLPAGAYQTVQWTTFVPHI
ncbi:hypothetical protein HWV62_12416 [Athelia sp. TMB]|nr:hypothetical protein HWV62_12416 [Athelia sp. TMB]